MPVASCLTAAALAASTPATIAALPAAQLQGRGADVAFTEYEAENACFDGTLIGPSRALHAIAAEASGRRAVRLERPGQFIEFTLGRAANAVTVRYAIPDSSDGRGTDARLRVSVGRQRIGSLSLTSRFGWFYGAYPFTNRPADGGPHHVFDEARLLFGKTLPAGTRVRLSFDASDRPQWAVVDLADFELVPPPLPRPRHSLSVLAYGADPSGKEDSSNAFADAIASAQRRRRTLWLDPGTYVIHRHVMLDRVSIVGAGEWYTVLRGRGVGLYGRTGAVGVRLADFAIMGDVQDRNDRLKQAGVGGTLGGGSTIEHLWLQHLKSGVWLDGPLTGVTIRHLRILDNSADGINLRRGVRNASIENLFVRNSGDDGIALWSRLDADANDRIDDNTVIAPILANGIAIYGGRNIMVSNNIAADTLTQGGGVHLGNRFDSVPLSGAIQVRDNVLVRTGSYDPNWRFGIGALWLYALDHPIDANVRISGTILLDSSFEAIQLIGKPIQSIWFQGTRVDGASHWLKLQSGGSATVDGLVGKNIEVPDFIRCDASFALRLSGVAPAFGRPSIKPCGQLDPKVVEHRLER